MTKVHCIILWFPHCLLWICTPPHFSQSMTLYHYTKVTVILCVCDLRAGGDRKPFDPRQRSLFSRHRWIWALQQTARLAIGPAATKVSCFKRRRGRIRLVYGRGIVLMRARKNIESQESRAHHSLITATRSSSSSVTVGPAVICRCRSKFTD